MKAKVGAVKHKYKNKQNVTYNEQNHYQ